MGPAVIMRRTVLSTLMAASWLANLSVPESAFAQTATEQALPAAHAAPVAPGAAKSRSLTAPTTHAVPTERSSAPVREWYGAPIIVTDLAAAGSMLVASQLVEREERVAAGLGLAGLGAYVLGGPIVHFAEGRTGAGLGSLALRVGAPFLGAGLGGVVGVMAAGVVDCDGEWCGIEYLGWGAVIGFAGGVVGALAVDHAELA